VGTLGVEVVVAETDAGISALVSINVKLLKPSFEP
jgi:hypothetical protein